MDDTRSIISVEEEATAANVVAIDGEYRQYIAEFKVDELPACSEGMRLLYDLAKSASTVYAMAARGDFQNAPPPVLRNPKWKAYATHVATCHDCNESRDRPIPYSGK